MRLKQSQFRYLLVVFVGMFTLASCSTFGSADNEAVQELEQQVNALSTQNALLLEHMDENNDNLQSPPTSAVESENVIENAVTPTPEELPTEPVAAGVPIIYDNWSLTVSSEIEVNARQNWGITVYVRNLGEKDRVFRFVNAGITVRDDLGNYYDYYDHSRCEQVHHVVKNFTVAGESVKELASYGGNGFVSCDDSDGIDFFTGPISLHAEQLIVEFQDFGPFTGVEIVIDL